MLNKRLHTKSEKYAMMTTNSNLGNDFASSFHKLSLIGCKVHILRAIDAKVVGKVGTIIDEGTTSLNIQMNSNTVALIPRVGLYGKVYFKDRCVVVNFELFGVHHKRFTGLMKSRTHFVGV